MAKTRGDALLEPVTLVRALVAPSTPLPLSPGSAYPVSELDIANTSLPYVIPPLPANGRQRRRAFGTATNGTGGKISILLIATPT